MKEAPNAVPTNKEIDEHVKLKEAELWLKSRLLAAVLCGSMAAFLAFVNEFKALGEHSFLWSGAVGFIVGGLLGERFAFTLFGVLIANYLLPNKCP